MADGAFTVDTDASPEIRDLLALDRVTNGIPDTNLGKVHLCFYDHGNLIERRVVSEAIPSRGGIKLTARSLRTLLGNGSDGPTIVDQQFVAGNNRLNNGSFESFGADALDPLYWKRDPDKSQWNFIGTGRTGNYAAVMLYLPDDDDVLVSDDTVETPPESVWEISAWIARGAVTNPGRIRLRIIYEGLFTHIDQIPFQHARIADGSAATVTGDITRTTDPLGTVAGPVLKVETLHRQLIVNPSFDAVLVAWIQTAGSWGTVAGPDGYICRTAGGGPDKKILTADSTYYPSEWFNVTAGDEYTFSGWLSQEASTDGFGIITCQVSCFPADATKPDYYVEIARKAGDGDLNWYYHTATFTIPDGYNLISPSLQAHLHTAGAWVYDNINLYRTRGNTDIYAGPLMVLAPKRAYRWKIPFRSDPSANSGTLQMQAVCNVEGRDQLVIQGMSLAPTGGALQTMEWEFTVPSGYDVVQWALWSSDVFDGAFYIGEGTLTETDTSTLAADVPGPGAPYDAVVRPYAQTVASFAAPAGATKAHVEVIAEAGAFGYTVDDVVLRRVDQPPVAATEVVRAFLNDPHTGQPILNPGDLHDAGPLLADWHVKNTVVGDGLKTLTTGGQVNPAREYRVNGAARSLDWGLPSELFVDHDGEDTDLILLRRGQLHLTGPLEGSSTIDGVVDEVRVVGAERTAANKTQQTITVDGALPNPTTYTAFGQPLRQTRTVSDSGIDSALYAAERVVLELALAQPTAPSITAELDEAKDWGPIEPGDWVYVYDPDADLIDETNEMADPDTGEPIRPMRLRVIDRTQTYTRGGRSVELVDPSTTEAGDGLDITSLVRWSDKTSQRLTLGVRKPEFLAFAGGAAPVDQLRRFFTQVTRV